MNYGLWQSAAGMQVNEYRQLLLTNNLANVDTTGFKRDLAVCQERRVESQTAANGFTWSSPLYDGLSGGPWSKPTYHDFAQGPLEQTGRDMDVALDGSGFLMVQSGDETRFTRDGRMILNAQNELVLVAGDGQSKVLDEAGQAITLNPGQRVQISSRGEIRQNNQTVAQLGIVDVDDTQKLRKVGENLFVGVDVQTRPATSSVYPGYIEGSNSEPTKLLTEMIVVQRAYEANARMVQLQDSINQSAVGRIGRVA